MTTKKLSPIIQLPRHIRAAGFEPPTYRVIYMHAIDQRFPAEQVGRCWYYDENSLPEIIDSLGLKAKAGA